MKFDLASKTISNLFSRTPYCEDPNPLAAGSFTPLHCSLSGSAIELEGRIRIGETPLPILYSAPGEIGVQIPWHNGFSTLSMTTASDSPFEPSQDLDIHPGAPRILLSISGLFGMKAAKGDWSGSLSSVPLTGELFHVYMTGLGPLDEPQTLGVPASLRHANPIRWKLGCVLLPRRQPVELVFAGIAPGMLGIYQTTFRMPELPARGSRPTGLECVLASPAMAVTFSPGSPAYGMCESCVVGPFTRPLPPR